MPYDITTLGGFQAAFFDQLQARFPGFVISAFPVHTPTGLVAAVVVDGRVIEAIVDARAALALVPPAPREGTAEWLYDVLNPGERLTIGDLFDQGLDAVTEQVRRTIATFPLDERYIELAVRVGALMGEQLVANRHKGHWGRDSVRDLMDHFNQEVEEFRAAVSDLYIAQTDEGLHYPTEASVATLRERVAREGADIANLVGMVIENAGAMPSRVRGLSGLVLAAA